MREAVGSAPAGGAVTWTGRARPRAPCQSTSPPPRAPDDGGGRLWRLAFSVQTLEMMQRRLPPSYPRLAIGPCKRPAPLPPGRAARPAGTHSLRDVRRQQIRTGTFWATVRYKQSRPALSAGRCTPSVGDGSRQSTGWIGHISHLGRNVPTLEKDRF